MAGDLDAHIVGGAVAVKVAAGQSHRRTAVGLVVGTIGIDAAKALEQGNQADPVAEQTERRREIGDQVVAVARPVPIDETVVTRAAGQCIVSSTAGDAVVVNAALDLVAAGTADQAVFAGAAENLDCIRADGAQHIRTRATHGQLDVGGRKVEGRTLETLDHQHVEAVTAVDINLQIVGVGKKQVVASAAKQSVAARAALQQIVAEPARQRIVAGLAVQTVVTCSASQAVVAGPAGQHHRSAGRGGEYVVPDAANGCLGVETCDVESDARVALDHQHVESLASVHASAQVGRVNYQDIVACAAGNAVAAATANQLVVATTADQRIVTFEPIDHHADRILAGRRRADRQGIGQIAASDDLCDVGVNGEVERLLGRTEQ